ncbi:sensor histidine kinase [Solirubrobacter sp. CPCC 204708]|uniref:histidine kinase n=1 Tax=Solirubrobacter deserti TaxID=2282478 RepID=A0ABT4RM37_9ACTN|nr:histidine kinase [Solirubrobacter deserti]MBE2320438.1 sensor histidine kinase [Solirubrobacter deserti]MDA0139371.1 histidine kinase [Solirubrobacter deserti]
MNPTLHRWLPVLVLPPILLVDGLLTEKPEQDIDAFSVVVTYLAVLPLVWRRQLGFRFMGPLLALGVAAVMFQYIPANTVVALPAWGLLDLARFNGKRQTVIAALALPPLVLSTIVPIEHDLEMIVSIWLKNTAICELALAVGYLMWNRQQAAEADAERRLAEERLRIAREVHDVVAHAMVAINVQSGVAAHLLDQDTEQAREALLHIKQTSGDALNDLRATLGVLRDPEQAAPVGPAAGIEDLDAVANQLRAAGVEVTVDVDTVGGVPTPVGAASYRIVQEALTNVLRHARATHASVVVRADDELLTIAVVDDGVGGGGPGGAGAGVRGMRERATALGGTLEAGRIPGGGWRVAATLPLSSKTRTAAS